MRKGEVWRVRLPVGPGHTQSGKRPAVIVQDDPFNAALPTVLIVPFTGSLAATHFGGTLVVRPDAHNGLTRPSVALIFQLSALDQRDCLSRLGVLDQNTLDQIYAVIDLLTGR